VQAPRGGGRFPLGKRQGASRDEEETLTHAKVGEVAQDELSAVQALMAACMGSWAPPLCHLQEVYLFRKAKIFVVRRGGVLGFAMAGPTPSRGGVSGTIYSLGIQQAVRRQGLGSALLAAAEGWLAGIGARTIWIPVPDGRPGVLTFFANWGYTIGEAAVALYGHGRDGLLLVRSVASDRTPAGLRSCWTRGGPWGEMDPNV